MRQDSCTTPRVNTNVNYGLWVITMGQYRLINCDKCTTVIPYVDSGEFMHIWTVCCEPKTALKNSLLIKRKKKRNITQEVLVLYPRKIPSYLWKTIKIFLPFLIIFLCEARLSSNTSIKITNTVTEWKSR